MLIQRKANSLKIYQRTMERSMLGINLRDKMRKDIIRSKTGVSDVVEQVATLKWRWTSHVARCKDERWNKRLLCCETEGVDEELSRPQSRWHDDIRRHASQIGCGLHGKGRHGAKWKRPVAQEWIAKS